MATTSLMQGGYGIAVSEIPKHQKEVWSSAVLRAWWGTSRGYRAAEIAWMLFGKPHKEEPFAAIAQNRLAGLRRRLSWV